MLTCHRVLVISLGSLCLLSYFVSFDTLLPFYTMKQGDQQKVDKKVFLIYLATPYYRDPWGRENVTCAGKKICMLTENKNRSKEAVAWVYHNRDFDAKYMVNSSSRQVHVMVTFESPTYETIRYPPNSINWTMSYKQDSDIWTPWGILVKKANRTAMNLDYLWKMKFKNLTAGWFVSNCHARNKRGAVVAKAKKSGLQIDIYGKCGIKMPNCPSTGGIQCSADIAKKYYFYFAMENSNCVDYVTEKFYNTIQHFQAVPVVMKREIYTQLGFPDKSYIALDDFNSIQDMVTFLNNVKKNKTEYLSYHQWRNDYELIRKSFNDRICSLCEKLQSPIQPGKSHSDLETWFSKATCDNDFASKYL